MKLFTIAGVTECAGITRNIPPRYDLRPMNHKAACNFARACTTGFTRWTLHLWPDSVPHTGEPLIASKYRR